MRIVLYFIATFLAKYFIEHAAYRAQFYRYFSAAERYLFKPWRFVILNIAEHGAYAAVVAHFCHAVYGIERLGYALHKIMLRAKFAYPIRYVYGY